jgi:hypothetical protein
VAARQPIPRLPLQAPNKLVIGGKWEAGGLSSITILNGD